MLLNGTELGVVELIVTTKILQRLIYQAARNRTEDMADTTTDATGRQVPELAAFNNFADDSEHELHSPDYSMIGMSTIKGENVYSEAATPIRKTGNKNSKGEDANKKNKKLICLAAISFIIIMLMLTTGCFIASFLELANLKSELSAVKQSNIDDRLAQLEDTENLQDKRIQQINASLAGFHPPFATTSCAALPPSSPSGYYWVRASNGSAVRVYCDMTRSCGGVTGGWVRVAELDMTNSSHQCPSGLRQRTDSNIRTCVRDSDSPGCSSVNFSSSTLEYSRVCGKIIAYQFGTPDAFNTGPFKTGIDNINTFYIEGVSLTHGNPRQHIWSFAAALQETDSPASKCPCININTANQAIRPPAFVGDDYFCDTGNDGPSQFIFYGDDPLWDGAGCGPLNTCCAFNNPPWFYKQLPQPTTDDIEMRVCRNGEASDEDIAIEMVEIYIQ